MVEVSKSNAQQALLDSRLKYAKRGIMIAGLAGATWGLQGTFMGKAGGMYPFASPEYDVWMLMVAALATGALHDFFAGIWITIYNVSTGRGLTEYKRLFKTKVGKLIVLAALFGGPLATGAYLMSLNLCGVTYTLAISGAYPVLGAFLGVIVFKEKISPRAWVGIFATVIGGLVVSYAPPSGDVYPYFYVGILLAVVAGIGWAFEGVTVTYANDMADPNIAVGLYRTFFSSFIFIFIAIPLFGYMGKHGLAGWSIIKQSITALNPIIWIALAAIFGGTSYLSFYKAMNMTGVGRAMSINITFSLWSIIFGVVFQALGIIEYHVTTQAIIGVLIVVFGTVLVIANPKELMKLRS